MDSRIVRCCCTTIAIAGCCTLVASAKGAAQAVDSTTVSGIVVSQGGNNPIEAASVQVDSSRIGGGTDKSGHFEITGVPSGPHFLRIRRIGYVQQRVSIVAGAASAPIVVVLVQDVNSISVPIVTREIPGSTLNPVTVYGTRTDLDEAVGRLRQIPGGTAFIPPTELRQTRQVNLKDALAFTPGVFVQPRFGAADESQISVRGSGLRDNFHARGINLLVNGMPYRNADGFTDFESLELLTTEAIEVYKGGNALRYGGSTLGGAINLDTKTGYNVNGVGPFIQGGSYGFFKGQLEAGGVRKGLDYYASFARTSLDGYRNWSDNYRDRLNLHAGYKFSDRVDARAFYFFAKIGEHLPGSLDRATFESAPASADPTNVAGRWGRNYNLHHLGTQLRFQISPSQRLELSPYLQYRDIDHPIFEVISQVSHDYGAELRYSLNEGASKGPNSLVLAAQTAWERMQNQQFVNQAGAHGALTKNQRDAVNMFAAYAEDRFLVTDALTAVAGARFESSDRRSRDFFLSNGDQSDARRYRPFTPKIGLSYFSTKLGGPLFGNVSRSFEPPLLLELNSLTVPGFIKLAGQAATQYEIGARGGRSNFWLELSAYDIELSNEILNVNVKPFPTATFTVPTYRNSPRTRHSGIEAGASYQMNGLFVKRGGGDVVNFRGAYTLGDFRFVRDSAYAGNQIPGAPLHHFNGEIKYSIPSGVSLASNLEWVPQGYFVNSANTARNDAWHTIGVRLEWAPRNQNRIYSMSDEGITSLFLSVQNLENRSYSGSVQVDNAAGKYFEPSDRRTWYLGFRVKP